MRTMILNPSLAILEQLLIGSKCERLRSAKAALNSIPQHLEPGSRYNMNEVTKTCHSLATLLARGQSIHVAKNTRHCPQSSRVERISKRPDTLTGLTRPCSHSASSGGGCRLVRHLPKGPIGRTLEKRHREEESTRFCLSCCVIIGNRIFVGCGYRNCGNVHDINVRSRAGNEQSRLRKTTRRAFSTSELQRE